MLLLHLGDEAEDFLDELGQRVVHLEERVEVARVADVPHARRLVLLPDALVHACNRLIVPVHRRFLLHALLDRSLEILVLEIGATRIASGLLVGHLAHLAHGGLLLG